LNLINIIGTTSHPLNVVFIPIKIAYAMICGVCLALNTHKVGWGIRDNRRSYS